MKVSNLFQFILGFILGVFLLAVGSMGAAYYFFNRMTETPPKPVFDEAVADLDLEPTQTTQQEPQPTATPKTETPVPPQTTAEVTTETEAEPPISASEPAETEAVVPEPETEETETSADTYQARVTWSNGLSLRAEPSQASQRLGGIDYNERVTVLGMSEDQVWQQVRLSNGTEAWVKAGNLQQVN